MANKSFILAGVHDPERRWKLEVVASPNAEQLHQHLLVNSLAYFAKHMLGMDVGEHHLEWSEAVANEQRVVIIAARDHG